MMMVHMENAIGTSDPVIPDSTVGKPSFEGIFDDEQELTGDQNWVAVPDSGADGNKIIISQEVKFPPEIAYQKMFVTGASGSGKSWTVGVICEEFSRIGLQFVLFDALGAHSGLSQLDNVIEVVPDMSKTVNVERLVQNIADNPNISVVVNLAHVDDPLGQEIVGEYCEELFKNSFSWPHHQIMQKGQTIWVRSNACITKTARSC